MATEKANVEREKEIANAEEKKVAIKAKEVALKQVRRKKTQWIK